MESSFDLLLLKSFVVTQINGVANLHFHCCYKFGKRTCGEDVCSQKFYIFAKTVSFNKLML